jgi:hypothetical protein
MGQDPDAAVLCRRHERFHGYLKDLVRSAVPSSYSHAEYLQLLRVLPLRTAAKSDNGCGDFLVSSDPSALYPALDPVDTYYLTLATSEVRLVVLMPPTTASIRAHIREKPEASMYLLGRSGMESDRNRKVVLPDTWAAPV